MGDKTTYLTMALLLCVSLVFISLDVSASSGEPRYDLEIFSDEFCDCDTDCRDTELEGSGCLTEDTDPRIKNLNRYSDDYIEAAQDNQYNGVCATYFLVVDDEYNELSGVDMTPECSIQYEVLDEPEVNETEQVNETETEEPVDEDPIEEIADDITEPLTNTTNQTAETNQTQTDNQNQTEEDNMITISTAQLIALTVIVLGFFGLMGWIAYLLKN